MPNPRKRKVPSAVSLMSKPKILSVALVAVYCFMAPGFVVRHNELFWPVFIVALILIYVVSRSRFGDQDVGYLMIGNGFGFFVIGGLDWVAVDCLASGNIAGGIVAIAATVLLMAAFVVFCLADDFNKAVEKRNEIQRNLDRLSEDSSD